MIEVSKNVGNTEQFVRFVLNFNLVLNKLIKCKNKVDHKFSVGFFNRSSELEPKNKRNNSIKGARSLTVLDDKTQCWLNDITDSAASAQSVMLLAISVVVIIICSAQQLLAISICAISGVASI